MKPSTPKTELPPSTRLRKAVFGDSHKKQRKANMNTPRIVNIDDLTSRTQKDALIHMTNAQWKKAISKARKYKGEKDLSLNRVTFNFIPISDEIGGLLNVTFKTKKGERRRLVPSVKRISGVKQVTFMDSRVGPRRSCIGSYSNGQISCKADLCELSCFLAGEGNCAGCVCGAIGRGPLVIL